jgi:hypothetical protein
MHETIIMRSTRVIMSLMLAVLFGVAQLGAVQAVNVRSPAHGHSGQV